MNEITPPIKWSEDSYGCMILIDSNDNDVPLKQINALLAERDRLRECHEAEFGVCHQYCDEAISLQNKLDSLMAIARRAKQYQTDVGNYGLGDELSLQSYRKLYSLFSAHEQKYGPINTGGE